MADEKKEKEYRIEDYDDESYKKKLPKDPKPDLSWVEEEEKERKKKQKAAAAAQSKALESSSGGGGGGGAENSSAGVGGSNGSGGGHSQNANAQGGAGGHGHGGAGWGSGGKSGRSGGVVPEPDSPALTQMPDHQHPQSPTHDQHPHEDRAAVPAKKPLAYKLKDADPLSGVYSDRMRDKIKKEAAKGVSETARDTEILKIARPIDHDDKWLIEKSFSPQFLKSKLNAGHMLPASYYDRSVIDQRTAGLQPPENQNQANEKSFVAPRSEHAKDLPLHSAGADLSASASPSLAPQTRADAAPPAPAPAKARDGGREM